MSKTAEDHQTNKINHGGRDVTDSPGNTSVQEAEASFWLLFNSFFFAYTPHTINLPSLATIIDWFKKVIQGTALLCTMGEAGISEVFDSC